MNLPLQTVLPKGFEFLLMDTEQQMWFFVEQYLRLQPVMADRISVLQFVFQLSYCTPGRQYHVRRLNAAQIWALRKFSAVGITLLRSRKSQYFQVGVYGSNLLFGHDMEVGAVPFGKKERLQAQQQHRKKHNPNHAAALKQPDGGVDSRFEWERDELISSRLELMVETNFYVTVRHRSRSTRERAEVIATPTSAFIYICIYIYFFFFLLGGRAEGWVLTVACCVATLLV